MSVVVPASNAARTLGDTLESLLSQSHPDWEAIVVDDGSTDETSDVASRFAARDSRVRVLTQSNAGESAARNTGIAAARHDWLLFLDADDWISPLHLERLTAELGSHPELDAVHCGYARVARDGTLVAEKYEPPAGDMFSTLARRAAFPVHTCVVRKSLVEDVGRFDTSLQKSADWDLWQRIARTGARFGAVREVLAFYRMQPDSASLNAHQLLVDGLRVLRRGHSRDPRVLAPHPDHAAGLPEEEIQPQGYYLVSWCAGLELGSGKDARPMLEVLGGPGAAELYPDAIAQCIFESAPLSTCQPPAAWEGLWPSLQEGINQFLGALETHSGSPELASRTSGLLKGMVLASSPTWGPVVSELERARSRAEEDRDRWRSQAGHDSRRIAELGASVDGPRNELAGVKEARDRWRSESEDHSRRIAELGASVDGLRNELAGVKEESERWRRESEDRSRALAELRATVDSLRREQAQALEDLDTWRRRAGEGQATIESLAASLEGAQREKVMVDEDRARWQGSALRSKERAVQLERQVSLLAADYNGLLSSPERRVGDYALNRLRLKRPALAMAAGVAGARHRLATARLAAERRAQSRGRLRMLATVCWNFPIYSQTFVYQELTQLIGNGFDLRLIYSSLEDRDQLPAQFSHLWRLKRRLELDRGVNERDFGLYRSRLPDKVEVLVDKLCQASGLSRQALLSHGNFLQAFSFTRMVEAYRPHYIHSYFFYDRSLMALVAGFLLDIPRGVSCYADHLLKDYELKVVPLHLELCGVVIATSERIRRELLEIAPSTDGDRILVKPNGIDTERYPVMERAEPAAGAPFRIVCVSRIEPKKGLVDLVDAVHLLRQRGVLVEAHLVGAADDWSAASRQYKQELDQRITELGLWGTVHLEGRQNIEGVLRFLGIAHVFVAPFVETEAGDKDGIPTSVLEAMSTGIPVVATNAGSIAEVVKNEHDGVLVPQRQPAAIADAVEALLRDPDERRSLGRSAAADVRSRFDVGTCEDAFHARLRALLPY